MTFKQVGGKWTHDKILDKGYFEIKNFEIQEGDMSKS